MSGKNRARASAVATRPPLIRGADERPEDWPGLWRAETGKHEGGEEVNPTIINAILGPVAAVMLVGVIGERDDKKQRNLTLAFMALVALIICVNTITAAMSIM